MTHFRCQKGALFSKRVLKPDELNLNLKEWRDRRYILRTSQLLHFSSFCLYRVRSGKKDSKKMRLLLLQTSSKTVAFFSFKIFRIYKRPDGSFTVHALYYLKTKTRSENVHYVQKIKKLDFLGGVL